MPQLFEAASNILRKQDLKDFTDISFKLHAHTCSRFSLSISFEVQVIIEI
jgi:hypothetical protein